MRYELLGRESIKQKGDEWYDESDDYGAGKWVACADIEFGLKIDPNINHRRPILDWQPIESAPRDGTAFVWVHYIRVLNGPDKPDEYVPYSDVVRRHWINEEKNGRSGDGFWMGQYGSHSDRELECGYWKRLPDPLN